MTNNQLLIKENAELITGIANLLEAKKQIEAKEKELRDKLLEQMEKYNVLGIENEKFTAQYIAPSIRETLDTKRLKKEQPEIAEKYMKLSGVSASVRFKVK